MTSAFDVLRERGFVYQATDGVAERLAARPVRFYVGFDPTADSLHAGSLVPLMAMHHLQAHGHQPIAVVGSGTALVGDPSGKTEMRQLLSPERIAQNAIGLREQIGRFVDFGGDRALLVDNGAWLNGLGYIAFLRDIGPHFRVNAMLQKESVRQRLESEQGISFLEFNYMLLQAYDFYVLHRDHGCELQMGGQDQYGNITAGIDLIHRLRGPGAQAFGITFPLLTDASGRKFGKTVAGAVWLAAERTAPFEYYQFWRNTADADVARFLGLFTLLPMDEVRRLGALADRAVNRAKEILAYEATRLVHGAAAAAEAWRTSVSEFGPADPDGRIETSSGVAALSAAGAGDVPTVAFPAARLATAPRLVELLAEAQITPSVGAARRLVRQGGISLNDERVSDEGRALTPDDVCDGAVRVRLGKKQRLILRFEA